MTSAASAPQPTLRLPSRTRAVPTSTRTATRRVPALVVPLLALLLGGGVVVAAQAAGSWATTGRDAQRASAPAADSAAAGAEVDKSALPSTPDDVKGWTTLQQIVDAGFPGVTEAGLRAEFAIPSTITLDTAVKELDGVVDGFSVPSLRTWLSAQG